MLQPPPDPADLGRVAALLRLAAALERALAVADPAPTAPAGLEIRIGAPLPLGPGGLLRCDLLLCGAARRPDPAAVPLVVSVGGAQRRDALLAPAAAADIAEAWHLDPRRGWLERYRAPRGGRYRLRELHYPGEGVPLPGGVGVVWLPGA